MGDLLISLLQTLGTILDAKKDGRRVVDGEFQTACSNACSDGAIVFGDINDKDSKISELNQKDRAYRLLESIGTKPNVLYQVKVTNSKKVQYMSSHYEAPIRKPLVLGNKSYHDITEDIARPIEIGRAHV